MENIPQFPEEERRDRISSSCEDLATLLEGETRLFDLVQRSCAQMQKVDEAKKLVKSLRKLLQKRPKNVSHLDRADLTEYISHPSNSYTLLYRTTRIWPKQLQVIKQHFSSLPKKKTKNLLNLAREAKFLDFPKEEDFTHGAINGLFNIQRFYNISTHDIARAKILENEENGRELMSSEEAIFIAEQAGKMKNLHFSVYWLKEAVFLAQEEGKNLKVLNNIKEKLEKAKEVHDSYIVREGFVNTILDSEKTRFDIRPFNKELEKSEEYLHNLDVLNKIK